MLAAAGEAPQKEAADSPKAKVPRSAARRAPGASSNILASFVADEPSFCALETEFCAAILDTSDRSTHLTGALFNSSVQLSMQTDRLSATLSALADPTRRAILARLATGEAGVTELAQPFSMSLPAISKQSESAGARGLDRARAGGTMAAVPAPGGPA